MRFTTEGGAREARERRRPRLFRLVAVALLTTACSSAPSTTDPYDGVWVGTIDDRAAGPGTLGLELRAASRVEGSWTASFGVNRLAGELASDASSVAQRTFAVGCSQGSMVWTTAIASGVMSGTYVTAGCGFLAGGRFEVHRR